MIIPVNAYQDLGTANGFCPDKIKKTKKKDKKVNRHENRNWQISRTTITANYNQSDEQTDKQKQTDEQTTIAVKAVHIFCQCMY